MKNIKVIYLDVDDTIMRNHDFSTITKELRSEIKRLSEKGIKIRIATGRTFDSAKRILDELGLNDTTILYNGALARDSYGNIVYEENLNKEKVDKLIDLSRDMNIHLNLYKDGMVYFEKETFLGMRYINQNKIKYEIIDLKTLNQSNKGIFMGEYEELLLLKERIEKEVKGVSPVFSKTCYLEVLSEGVSKGSAIENVAKLENIELENIMAFGDQWNDLAMLQKVGYGFLMGNANEDIKKLFPKEKITESLEENGVANRLKEIEI